MVEADDPFFTGVPEEFKEEILASHQKLSATAFLDDLENIRNDPQSLDGNSQYKHPLFKVYWRLHEELVEIENLGQYPYQKRAQQITNIFDLAFGSRKREITTIWREINNGRTII